MCHFGRSESRWDRPEEGVISQKVKREMMFQQQERTENIREEMTKRTSSMLDWQLTECNFNFDMIILVSTIASTVVQLRPLQSELWGDVGFIYKIRWSPCDPGHAQDPKENYLQC